MLLVLGIGNPNCGDDAAGHLTARALSIGGKTEAIAAGTTPEAHTGAIRRLHPDTILLVDAVQMGAAPGELALLTRADLAARPAAGTHRLPLALLMHYLELETGAQVMLLGIQPADTTWGSPLSEPVRAAVRRALALIKAPLENFAPMGYAEIG
jgi:hydrogenase 3 maturation protease